MQMISLQAHNNDARNQRAVIKDVIKAETLRYLEKQKQGGHLIVSVESCSKEFNDCLDRWVCDHESNTRSDKLFLSKENEQLLASVTCIYCHCHPFIYCHLIPVNYKHFRATARCELRVTTLEEILSSHISETNVQPWITI